MGGNGQNEGGWCILRTAPRSTLSLAKTLAEDGYGVWTPRHVIVTPKTRRRPSEEREAPIMPTFVFAAALDLPRLQLLRASVASRHAGFSIFRYAGRIPIIGDADLRALRVREELAAERLQSEKRRRLAPPSFTHGQSVKVDGDVTAFAGLEGVVEGQNGEDVLVCFGGSIRFKISAWLLNPNDICSSRPIGIAA